MPITEISNLVGDFGHQIASSQLVGFSDVHKFGHINLSSSTFVPVTQSGIYHMPQVSGVTTLRIKAGNVNDAAAGTGAQEITLEGLDETGAYVTEALVTAGTSASAASSTTFLRLFRAWVSKSNTYATTTASSHAGVVIVENGAGSEDWAIIPNGDYPFGQSEIGFYSVPLGKTAYVKQITIEVDTNKSPDVAMFKREGILKTSGPYDAMRVIQSFIGVEGSMSEEYDVPIGPFPALTDFGFMTKVSAGTAEVSVDFTIVLKDD